MVQNTDCIVEVHFLQELNDNRSSITVTTTLTMCSVGIYIINLKKTWEKLLFAARAIAAIENPADVCVISARPYGQRAVLKFAYHTGATPIAGRFTPGTFTNQIQVQCPLIQCFDKTVKR